VIDRYGPPGAGASLVRSDATAIPLGDNTVDLICTSPPYFALRSYQDGGEHYGGQIGSEATPTAFLEALWAVTAECWRVLKPSGSLFVNLGDKYAGSGGHNNDGISAKSTLSGNGHKGGMGKAGPNKVKATKRSPGKSEISSGETDAARPTSRRQAPDRYNQASDGIRAKSLMGLPWRYAIGCIDGQADPDGRGWVLRSEIVWSKPNGLPESVTDRVRRSHEQWFHMTKEGRYYSNVDEVREPHETAANGMTWSERKASGEGMRYGDTAGGASEGSPNSKAGHPLGKLPGSVWTVPTQPLIVPDWLDVDHFAAFPTEWPRRLILGWSPPDGIVLDPFGGTGTTAMVARALGRYGVSCDLSGDYQRLARWRIWQSGQAARVAAKTESERQLDMFATLQEPA
jgi:DNA modification methylase